MSDGIEVAQMTESRPKKVKKDGNEEKFINFFPSFFFSISPSPLWSWQISELSGVGR